jgi:hypothetical protein
VAGIGALLAGAAALLFVLHSWYGSQLISDPRHRVTLEQIHITAPPAWIDSDAAELKKQAASLGKLPPTMDLHDAQLTVQVAEAFRRHPWVHQVQQVVKEYPARVTVELEYRRPVAMVEHGPDALLPVDMDGICLPTGDFSPQEARQYPRIADPGSEPQTKLAGYTWGDPRVEGAAQIAAALQPHWTQLPLAAIHVPPKHPSSSQGGPVFQLETEENIRITWGRPPGSEQPGEPLAADKIARLVEIFRPTGGQPRSLPETIDLRVGRLQSAPVKDEEGE